MGAFIKEAINVTSAVSGVLAAVLWFHASRVQVDDDPDDPEAKIVEDVGGRTINVLHTAKAQTVWNARASACAAIAAIAQALLLFF